MQIQCKSPSYLDLLSRVNQRKQSLHGSELFQARKNLQIFTAPDWRLLELGTGASKKFTLAGDSGRDGERHENRLIGICFTSDEMRNY